MVLEYLSFAPTKSPSYVRKYTSTMEHMGYTQIISTHKFSDQTYGKFAVILLSFLKQNRFCQHPKTKTGNCQHVMANKAI